MTAAEDNSRVLFGRALRKTFRRDTGEVVRALDGVSLGIPPGTLAALVGPDGAGKTTLLRLITGLLLPDAGELKVLGVDVATNPQQVQERISYMPQKFGLYEDLSVQDNLNLYADMHGLSAGERRERYPQLLEMTALGPFTDRLAGRLSGGMKRNWGWLAPGPLTGIVAPGRANRWCRSVIAPGTVGDHPPVGPRSRPNGVAHHFVLGGSRAPAASCRHAGGQSTCQRPSEGCQPVGGRPGFRSSHPLETARGLQARLLEDPGIVDAVPEGGRVPHVRAAEGGQQPNGNGTLQGIHFLPTQPRFEDGFMVLLRRTTKPTAGGSMVLGQPPERHGGAAVEVRELVRKFGNFTAVDRVSFEVHRGEVFGLLGPNGAGKTTTFRMLCGLLPATSGRCPCGGGGFVACPGLSSPANRLCGSEVLALRSAFRY